MIRLRGVVRSFGDTRVLAGVHLDVSRGELVTIGGERGCGKTTLLHVLAKLIPADSGTVEIEGPLALADGWLAPGDELTTSEYLEFAAGLRRGAGASLVTLARLEPHKRIGTLAADERIRLSVACALESRRDAILVDAAVDPCFADRLRERLTAGAAIVTTAATTLDSRALRLHAGRLETMLSATRREVAWIA